MGSILQGHCKCGFDTGDIFAGGGFLNFQKTCNAPAICIKCSKFLIKNYMKKETVKCPTCRGKVTFYNDSTLQRPTVKVEFDEIFSWNIDDESLFTLPNTKYLCPKCKKMTLVFGHGGCWD